jgi:hypothetical protein
MRIANWPALVCGWVLATLPGQTVRAADLEDDVSNSAFSVEETGVSGPFSGPGAGSRFQPEQYAGPAPYSGYGAGMTPAAVAEGYPSGLPPTNAWPETSPFTQHRIEETYNEAGLWNYDSDDNFARSLYFSLDYLYGHGLREGVQFIGDPNFVGASFMPVDPSLFPNQTTRSLGLTNLNPFHNGLLARYGFWNPDGSGAVLSGFVLFENTLSNARLVEQQAEGPTNLQPLAAIIMNNNGQPVALPFDTRFFHSFTQEILGADADYYSSAFFTRPAFTLKMQYGVKYLRVSEQFFLQGDDSGLGYVVPATGGQILPPFLPITGAPYSAILNNSVTSNLVGPTIGLRYDLGGKHLKFWGQSKFGVMANIQHSSIASQNLNEFKDSLIFLVVPGPAAGTVFPTTLHTSNTTHISPLFDQQFNMEFPFFVWIPYLNRWKILREANVRIGWQYVVAGSIARPSSNINYNLNDPSTNGNRTWFEYNTFNFGARWQW